MDKWCDIPPYRNYELRAIFSPVGASSPFNPPKGYVFMGWN